MKNSYQLYPEVRINGNLRIVDEIYIAPLGHLMIKFYKPLNKTWSVYNIGKWEEELLPHIQDKIGADILIKT